ncbi:MAG: FAD-dependent oxidoreductase, partial [Caulobacteraceae bacterium]
WGGYAIPTRDGVLFGATHDRGDLASGVRGGDHVRNLALLGEGRPALAARLVGRPLEGRAAIRAATRDHLPAAGALKEPGLFALTGLGGRGFTLAPLLAEHIAALAAGAASPLPYALAKAVDPLRLDDEPKKARGR